MSIPNKKEEGQTGKTTERLKRLDFHARLNERVLPLCRLKYGEVWEDPVKGHKVGVLDATKLEDIKKITKDSMYTKTDIRNEEEVKNLFKQTSEKFGL